MIVMNVIMMIKINNNGDVDNGEMETTSVLIISTLVIKPLHR